MAAGVDFGDLELFEAFDPPEESTPKPVHTRFKDDDDEEEDDDEANGAGDAELQEQLRHCEETIQQLRAENILPAGPCHPGLGVRGGRRGTGAGEIPRGSAFGAPAPAARRAGGLGRAAACALPLPWAGTPSVWTPRTPHPGLLPRLTSAPSQSRCKRLPTLLSLPLGPR